MRRSIGLLCAMTLSACGSAPSGGAATTAAASGTTRPASAPTVSAAASAQPSASAAASVPDAAGAGIVLGAPAGAPKPFVLFLHGLGASGARLVDTLGVAGLARDLGFAYAAPDGDPNKDGQRFWNAGAACCDFDHTRPDHVARLRHVIDVALAQPAIDPKRVYVIGFSNGGFMAHRLACDEPRVRGVGTLGSAGPRDDEPCPGRPPLALVAVNGDADKAVSFAGGSVLGRRDVPPHPGARDTVLAWAKRDGCSGGLDAAGTLDLEPSLPGEETSLQRVAGCPAPVELWVVHGGGHFSGTSERGTAAVYRALVAATP